MRFSKGNSWQLSVPKAAAGAPRTPAMCPVETQLVFWSAVQFFMSFRLFFNPLLSTSHIQYNAIMSTHPSQ